MINLLDRILRPKRKTKTKFDFVPVIFANGEDDDLPGFTAAIKNERVQFDDKIYAVGEALIIEDRQFVFSCHYLHIGAHGDTPPENFPTDGSAVFVTEGNPSRVIRISKSFFRMGVPPRM